MEYDYDLAIGASTPPYVHTRSGAYMDILEEGMEGVLRSVQYMYGLIGRHSSSNPIIKHENSDNISAASISAHRHTHTNSVQFDLTSEETTEATPSTFDMRADTTSVQNDSTIQNNTPTQNNSNDSDTENVSSTDSIPATRTIPRVPSPPSNPTHDTTPIPENSTDNSLQLDLSKEQFQDPTSKTEDQSNYINISTEAFLDRLFLCTVVFESWH